MTTPGTRADHNTFCTTENWQLVTNARGKPVGDDVTYELELPDARILRTRISRPVNKNAYGIDLWKTILRDQLDVTEGEFWACVNEGRTPDRGGAVVEQPEKALPASLVYQLIHEAGLPDEEAATMSLDDAMAVMTKFWSTPR